MSADIVPILPGAGRALASMAAAAEAMEEAQDAVLSLIGTTHAHLEEAEAAMLQAVALGRVAGWSWDSLAEAAGMATDTFHKRYARLVPPGPGKMHGRSRR